MGILRNYIERGIPDNNRFYFESGNKPLVTKDIPVKIDSRVPNSTNQITRRVNDLERIAKLLIKPPGLKYIANETMLQASTFKPDPNKTFIGNKLKQLGSGLLGTAKTLGSTLAQVPVNGTGTHFVKGFAGQAKNTYLRQQNGTKLGAAPHALALGGGEISIDPTRSVLLEYLNSKFAPQPFEDNKLKSDSLQKESDELSNNKSIRVRLGDPTIGDKVLARDGINMLSPFDPTEDQFKRLLDRNNIELKDGAYKTQFGQTLGRDFVKFRIHIVTPGERNNAPSRKVLFFRAFLDNFNDNYSGNWNTYNYVGRGENFYTYNGLDRQISLGFKVAAQTGEEMRPIYQKLNYLVSSVAPTYEDNFMRGTFVQMTVGDYIYELPGIMNSVSLDWQSDYPWEIAMNRPEELERDIPQQELPMILNCNLTFTPIHKFLPTADGDRNAYITNATTPDERNKIVGGRTRPRVETANEITPQGSTN